MNKVVRKYQELRNQQCENLDDPEMSCDEYERQKVELPKQVQEELTRSFGTFEICPDHLLRIMFVLVNNLYVSGSSDEQHESNMIEDLLLVIQKFAILHDLKFTVENMEWPRQSTRKLDTGTFLTEGSSVERSSKGGDSCYLNSQYMKGDTVISPELDGAKVFQRKGAKGNMKVQFSDRFVDESCLLVTCDLETSKVSTSVVNKPMFEFELDMYGCEKLNIPYFEGCKVERKRLNAYALEFEIYLTFDLPPAEDPICDYANLSANDMTIADETIRNVKDVMLYMLVQRLTCTRMEAGLLQEAVENFK